MEKELSKKIKNNWINWLKGQVLLALIVAILSGTAFYFIGLPYYIPLAIFVFFLEFLPYIGPVIGFIPAFIVAITTSLQAVILTIVVYIAIQLLESYVLHPLIMKKAVGLSPLVTIASVILGSIIFGPLGAILAVPIVSTIVLVKKYYENKNQKNTEDLEQPE